MVGWHHQLNGHEFEQASGDGEGQGSLECCSPWGRKELDTTERLNRTTICPGVRFLCCMLNLFGCVRLQLHGLSSTRLSLCPWDSPGQNTRAGCNFLLQGVFLSQGLNLHLLRLLHCHAGSLPLAPSGKPPKRLLSPVQIANTQYSVCPKPLIMMLLYVRKTGIVD